MGGNNKYGSITLGFSGFPKGGKIYMATLPLASRGAHVGIDQHGYITCALSRSPWWGNINVAR